MKTVHQIVLGMILVFSSHVSAAERLSVYTVNYPLAYFAERIGDDQVEVVFPAPADVDPAYWMPDRTTIAAYQQADLILLNGANYAKWIGKVSLPRSKMVDTSRKFKDRYLYTSEVTTHSHGTEGAHAHESLAFTTWLDFSLAKLQAESIYEALARKRPMSEIEFKRNYQTLAGDLDKLHAQITAIVARDPDRTLLGTHSVYDYLNAGYEMNLKSVHWDPDEAPTVSRWNDLKHILEGHQGMYMLWKSEPLLESVSDLRKKGIESVVFSPSANRPDSGDFLTVMRANIGALALAYK